MENICDQKHNSSIADVFVLYIGQFSIVKHDNSLLHSAVIVKTSVPHISLPLATFSRFLFLRHSRNAPD